MAVDEVFEIQHENPKFLCRDGPAPKPGSRFRTGSFASPRRCARFSPGTSSSWASARTASSWNFRWNQGVARRCDPSRTTVSGWWNGVARRRPHVAARRPPQI